MARIIDGAADLLGRIPHSLIALLGRLSLAWIFWVNGRAGVGDSWMILQPHPRSIAMFRGAYDISYVPAEVAALAVQIAEFTLPVLLAFGLATRFAALGLLVLVAVFELFVQHGPYATHGVWAAVLLMIIKYGPGSVSLDEMLGRR